MSLRALRAGLLVVVGILLGLVRPAPTAIARPALGDHVPNGGAFDCLLCHLAPRGGGGWNRFGYDLRAQLVDGQPVWSSLHHVDSDGDGQSNGEELGDPCGVWSRGAGPPPRAHAISNPGDPDDASSDPRSPPCGDPDAGALDGATSDAGTSDEGAGDAAPGDAGVGGDEAGDAGERDLGRDETGTTDAGTSDSAAPGGGSASEPDGGCRCLPQPRMGLPVGALLAGALLLLVLRPILLVLRPILLVLRPTPARAARPPARAARPPARAAPAPIDGPIHLRGLVERPIVSLDGA